MEDVNEHEGEREFTKDRRKDKSSTLVSVHLPNELWEEVKRPMPLAGIDVIDKRALVRALDTPFFFPRSG